MESAAHTEPGSRPAPWTTAWQRIPGWLKDVTLVALLYFGIQAYQGRDAPSGQAPALASLDPAGAPISLESALAQAAGAPVVLHFWASWCGVCKAEESNLVALATDRPVLTVATRSGDAEAVRSYLEKRGADFPVALDSDGALADRFGVHSLPTTFVIDGDGHIRDVEVGYTTELGLRLRLLWAEHF